MVLIVRKDSAFTSATSLEDFAGANVGAQKDTFHDGIIDQIPNVTHAVPLKSFPELTIAVSSGALDAMVSELPVAKAIVASNPNLQIIRFDAGAGFETGADATVSVGVQKGNDTLLEAINAALTQLSTEARDQMMEDAILRQPQ
ncbi:MAG: ABC transporter substrate-binding protein/permease, partial [Erysipelotrichaceae bacterium]